MNCEFKGKTYLAKGAGSISLQHLQADTKYFSLTERKCHIHGNFLYVGIKSELG